MNLAPASWDTHKEPDSEKSVEDFHGCLLFSRFMGVETGMWVESRQVISSLQNSNMELAFPNCSKAFYPNTGSAISRSDFTLPSVCSLCAERSTQLLASRVRRLMNDQVLFFCQQRHVHLVTGFRNLAAKSHGVFQSHPKVLFGLIFQLCPVNRD